MIKQHVTSSSSRPALQAEMPPLGAHSTPDGVHFAVWASAADRVDVMIEDGDARRTFMLHRQGDGLHAGEVPGLGAGARYWYRLDEDRCYPDPASRFQPEGVHGPSE